MPGGFPGNYSICNAQAVGALPASTHGTTITASGSTNTKGTYTSLITATAFDCCFVMLEIVVSTAEHSVSGCDESTRRDENHPHEITSEDVRVEHQTGSEPTI